mmetsp:Transcript_7807/g.12891  ORF Transcript_7807/g.12891 Transcript_7807/m.12891 type:complete len:204 (+) Transcript_7807:570-1181(+)
MNAHHRDSAPCIKPKVPVEVMQKLVSVHLISIDITILPSITDIIRILTRLSTDKSHGVSPGSRDFQGSQCTENPGISTTEVLVKSLHDRTELLHDTFQPKVINMVQIDTSITPISFITSLTIMKGQTDNLCNILQILIQHGSTFLTYIGNYVSPPEMCIPSVWTVTDWIAIPSVDSVLVTIVIIGTSSSSRLPCWFLSWFIIP